MGVGHGRAWWGITGDGGEGRNRSRTMVISSGSLYAKEKHILTQCNVFIQIFNIVNCRECFNISFKEFELMISNEIFYIIH